MEPCHEYLGCKKAGCIMSNRKDVTPCWEVEGTLCNHIGIKIMQDRMKESSKKEACKRSGCIYFKEAIKKGLVSDD